MAKTCEKEDEKWVMLSSSVGCRKCAPSTPFFPPKEHWQESLRPKGGGVRPRERRNRGRIAWLGKAWWYPIHMNPLCSNMLSRSAALLPYYGIKIQMSHHSQPYIHDSLIRILKTPLIIVIFVFFIYWSKCPRSTSLELEELIGNLYRFQLPAVQFFGQKLHFACVKKGLQHKFYLYLKYQSPSSLFFC